MAKQKKTTKKGKGPSAKRPAKTNRRIRKGKLQTNNKKGKSYVFRGKGYNTAAQNKPVPKTLPNALNFTPKKNKKNVKKQELKTTETTSTGEAKSTDDRLTPLQRKMHEKLSGGKFRWITEKLHTCDSKSAFEMFHSNPELYQEYHEGFRTQVSKWPANPLDEIIAFLNTQPEYKIVADFGCGDAKLAKSVRQKVHSLDLVATNELVTACDMAHVPLGDDSIDIAVYCLSLMGTNTTDFIKEAYRVIKPEGLVKIAEVKSRFADRIGDFIAFMAQFSFSLVNKDESNQMFVAFTFKMAKEKSMRKKIRDFTFQACVYKKR